MAKNENSLDITEAGFNIGVNVKLTKRNKYTGKILEERQGHNMCLKMQLMGLVKWLNGEFNPTQSYLLSYDWIPRYLAVGTNIASGSIPVGISSEVTINDTRLLHELSPRIILPERNKIINRNNQNYIQLVISSYLPEESYIGQAIGEAGLFSKESGNNCLFRIVFPPIVKEQDTVIEVNWVISIISVASGNQPYEPLDKSDLMRSMNQLIARFAELYPELSTACTDLYERGIYDYGRSDLSQAEVDADVELLNLDYEALRGATPINEINTLIDDINGEEVE